MGQGGYKPLATSSTERSTLIGTSTTPRPVFKPPTSYVATDDHDAGLVEHFMATIKHLMEETQVPMHQYHCEKTGALEPPPDVRIYLLQIHKKPVNNNCWCDCCYGEDDASYHRDLQGHYISSPHFDLSLFKNTLSYYNLLRRIADQPAFTIQRGYYANCEWHPKIGKTNERVWLKLIQCKKELPEPAPKVEDFVEDCDLDASSKSHSTTLDDLV